MGCGFVRRLPIRLSAIFKQVIKKPMRRPKGIATYAVGSHRKAIDIA